MVKSKVTIQSTPRSAEIRRANTKDLLGVIAAAIVLIALAAWLLVPEIRSGGSFGGLGLFTQSLVVVVGGGGVLMIAFALFFLPVREWFRFDMERRELEYRRRFVLGSQTVRRPLDEIQVRVWSYHPARSKDFKLQLPGRTQGRDASINVIGVSLTFDGGLKVTAVMGKASSTGSDQTSVSQTERIRTALERIGVPIDAGAPSDDS